MLKFLIFLSSILCVASACSQTETRMNISAKYISMYFKKKGAAADWESSRKMNANYSCQEQKDGTLHIKYSPSDSSVTIYKPVIGIVIGDRSKVPNEIGGYKLKNLYLKPEEPEPYYHAIYTNLKTPNSMLIVHHIELGKYIIGAAYFSNDPKNPFKEKNIHFKLP